MIATLAETRRKVHHYDPRLRRLMFILAAVTFLFACVPVILHILFAGKYTGSISAFIPFTGLVAFLASGVLYSARQSRIVTSPDGIECYDVELCVSVRTPWDNLESIVTEKNGSVLVLRKPVLPANPIRIRLGLMFKMGKYIPLKNFMWQWHNGGLEQEVRHFAPHVFLEEHKSK